MSSHRTAGTGLVTAALAMTMVAACGMLGDRTPHDDRFVRLDQPRDSPSGEFTASVEPGPVQNGVETLIVVVSDADGGEVFRDVYAYSTRHGVGVTWLSDRDQLWILSGDVGTSRVEENPDGVWTKTNMTPETLNEIPTEIDALRTG